MKYLKLSLLSLLAGAMFSCSEEDTAAINSGDATISFAQTEYTVDERTSQLNIPVNLTGDHNGDVKFNVVVKEVHGTKVVADETVVLTSNDWVMPAGVGSVDVQVYMYAGTPDITEGRYYVLEMTSAEGAKMSATTVRVNLTESKDPMGELKGTWLFNATNNGKPVSFQFTIAEHQADPDGTLGYLACSTANFNANGLPANWDMRVMGTSLQFVMEKTIASGIDFGMPEWGLCSVRFGHFTMTGGQLGLGTGAISGSWNEDYSEVEFPSGPILGTWIYDENGAQTGNIWTLYDTYSFTRVN